jgi:hypothetical protein
VSHSGAKNILTHVNTHSNQKPNQAFSEAIILFHFLKNLVDFVWPATPLFLFEYI